MPVEHLQAIADAFEKWNRGDFEGAAEHFSDMEEVGDRVLVDVFATAEGKSSGAEVADAWFQLYSFRDGEICRAQPFGSHEDALAAAESQ